jgi:hypothetical protein
MSPEHPLNQVIAGFDLLSYYAGITASFAEVVAMGCKRLALSPAYTHAEFARMQPATQQIITQRGLLQLIEPDLLITRLFPADIAAGRVVVLIAKEQATFDEYIALKALRVQAIAEQRLAEIEIELAWRFGHLLSYTDTAIQTLLADRVTS